MNKIIYDNVTLDFVINSIITRIIGLEETENLEDLIIYSKSNPETIIKYIDSEITNLENYIKLFSNIKNINEYSIETNIEDFIVFTVDYEEKMIKNMSILEYINIAKTYYNIDIMNINDFVVELKI